MNEGKSIWIRGHHSIPGDIRDCGSGNRPRIGDSVGVIPRCGLCNVPDRVHEMKTILEEGEPFVNQDLVDRSEWIINDTILHDDTFKIHDKEEEEANHLSELWRLTRGMDKRELAICTMRAMERYPFMVMQVVAEYLVRIKEGKE